MKKIFENGLTATGMILTIAIIAIIGALIFVDTKTAEAPEEPVFCTQDAKQCPDGSFVGRVAPNCEFEACPDTSNASTTLATVVNFDGKTFSPQNITIKAGETVKFINKSDSLMWVASNPHPIHTDYSEFDNREEIGQGESYEFTFTQVGNWKYHNHRNSSQVGTVVVK